jgi:hypothetical protein
MNPVDLTLAAPFRSLSRKPQLASSTISLSKSSLPLISTYIFLRHFYIFPALFSITAGLSDVLVILSAVIPYGPGRMWQEFLISAYTCMGILALMVICLVGLVF